MSHHGSGEEPSEFMKQMRNTVPDDIKAKLARMQEMTGATGNFPHGKLGAGDEGEIAMAVGSDPAKGVVFIDFGKQVRWFGMEPAQVDGLIELLQHHKERLLAGKR